MSAGLQVTHRSDAVERGPGGPATTFRLACEGCGREEPALPLATTCRGCGGPVQVRYDAAAASGPQLRSRWEARPGGMWRYAELLPLRPGERPLSLGEGSTPLLELGRLGERLGLRLLAKDEGSNPTGSFKDRGLAAAVTRAAADGAERFVVPSAGNAGVSLAAYAARAGLPARIYLPADTPPVVERRAAAYGAEVVRVPGLIGECGAQARKDAQASGAFDVSTLREPYRLEGKKTMMLEIVQALGWRPPDAIVYPTGGGTGLIGSWKALRELEALGIVRASTRLYAVQSRGCAPLVRALEAGAEHADPDPAPATSAWGLRVAAPFGGALALRALRETSGGAVAVADREMEEAAGELRRLEGVAAGIEGGATLAGAVRLRREGRLAEGETVVLFNTGHFLNY